MRCDAPAAQADPITLHWHAHRHHCEPTGHQGIKALRQYTARARTEGVCPQDAVGRHKTASDAENHHSRDWSVASSSNSVSKSSTAAVGSHLPSTNLNHIRRQHPPRSFECASALAHLSRTSVHDVCDIRRAHGIRLLERSSSCATICSENCNCW